MRSDRLLAMLLLLQAHGGMSASQIAARLEVSVRTVYRDMESLSTAGIPVYADRGRNGGIRILPDFRTDVTGLTGDEAQALFVFVDDTPHDDLGLGESLRSGLRKLMAALPAAYRAQATRVSERILVDPSPWGAPVRPAPELTVVQEGVFAGRMLSFGYEQRDVDAPVVLAGIEPLGLVTRGGSWYLVAVIGDRYRMFRVDRMSNVRLLEESPAQAEHPPLFEVWRGLDADYRRDYSSVRVRARVRRRSLGIFLRAHERDLAAPTKKSESAGAEWTEVELNLRSFGHAQALLAFGTDVEIIEPADLVRHLDTIVEALHERRIREQNAGPLQ